MPDESKPCLDYNRIFFLVNMERCGWCRKFRPVIETNLGAMNDCARAACTIADSGTDEGAAVFAQLGYRGGIPCVAALRPNGEVIDLSPGYKDNKDLGPMLARLMRP